MLASASFPLRSARRLCPSLSARLNSLSASRSTSSHAACPVNHARRAFSGASQFHRRGLAMHPGSFFRLSLARLSTGSLPSSPPASSFFRAPSSASHSGSSASGRPSSEAGIAVQRIRDSDLFAVFQNAAEALGAAGDDAGAQNKRGRTVSTQRLFQALVRSGILERELAGEAKETVKAKNAPAVEFRQLCEFYESGRFYENWGGGARIMKLLGVKGLAPPGGNLKGGIIDATPKSMNYEEFRAFTNAVRVWLRDEVSPVPLSGRVMRATNNSARVLP
ncbi:hypothetical protein BESB_062940 [Besnoitia besnoiti]|uniref:Uncharacterized protein n=1 Tax=Besnoitia besnoiti TaxID=94643 RepID=A0A2A9MIJ5_BESBE|nr:hypothetical protein BESB_062940 [Besnoitia besnoiti]PFH35407.1 hypothetical protein BESB_062940 [Besnoitia besnoiti]